MQVTSDQIQAIRQGEPVRIASQEDGLECVVIRADIYDRVSALLDDSLSEADVGLLIERTMHEDDLQDPLLESYQKYRP
ncbi:MAG TPA: hypothetical protein VJ783_28540 [Pirellulales bacterium]|nr:hypothetical protein [Pirellulales bacterium]